MRDRNLDWEGCFNVRDLGGLSTIEGRLTRWGAVALAQPCGVVIHCRLGRDRTGIVTLLLLALADVTPDEIASDYELSNIRLRPRWVELGEEDQSAWAEKRLGRANTSARALILATLASLDVDAYLRAGGLGDDDLSAIRARLLE
jgi:protein-tyrosine phosphatase